MSTFANTGLENSDTVNYHWDKMLKISKDGKEKTEAIRGSSQIKSKDEVKSKYAIWFLFDSIKYMKYFIPEFEKRKGIEQANKLREKLQVNEKLDEYDDVLKKLIRLFILGMKVGKLMFLLQKLPLLTSNSIWQFIIY